MARTGRSCFARDRLSEKGDMICAFFANIPGIPRSRSPTDTSRHLPSNRLPSERDTSGWDMANNDDGFDPYWTDETDWLVDVVLLPKNDPEHTDETLEYIAKLFA